VLCHRGSENGGFKTEGRKDHSAAEPQPQTARTVRGPNRNENRHRIDVKDLHVELITAAPSRKSSRNTSIYRGSSTKLRFFLFFVIFAAFCFNPLSVVCRGVRVGPRHRTAWDEAGAEALPRWEDIWLGPAMKLVGSLAARSPGLRLALALEIERHRSADEILQGRLIDLVAFVDVDGAPDIPFEARVE